MSEVRPSVVRRLGSLVVKVLSLFVILEPIWMLLPFAGFLYGSVLRIQTLNQNPHTAWLTHFVFPVLTGGPLGPVLVVLGFVLFCIGAGQIYTAKIRKSGLVTGGLYRFVRHPQYIALTFFGLGILLTWGRAITFIAFFVMMFLYYHLARSEERNCVRLFGEAYERYRKRTSFVVPGDKHLRPLAAKFPRLGLPAPVRMTGAFVVMLAVCFALIWAIDRVKESLREVPYLAADVPLGPAKARAGFDMRAVEANGVPFVCSERIAVARGPYRNAWASGFAEGVLRRLPRSAKLGGFLKFLEEPGRDVAVVFCGPYKRPGKPGTPGMHAGGGPAGRGPAPDPHGPSRVRLIIMRCSLAEGASLTDALRDTSKRRITGGCIAQVNLARPEDQDLVEGAVIVAGPRFPGEQRWEFFLKQLAPQRTAGRRPATVAVPGLFATGTLVLVKAPILRTRLDPEFAKELRDRLAGSATLRAQLRRSGVGGRVVAVAFPRPGPNWYREHHGKPQVSVFVIVAELREGRSLDALFEPRGRRLLSAFIADMDLKVEPPADCVGQITTIGAWRDLEERWRFFLSSVGGSHLHFH